MIGRVRLNTWTIVTIVALAVLVVFLVLPILSIIKESFIGDSGQLGLANYAKVFLGRYYRTAVLHTIFVSSLSVLGAAFIGIILAYIVVRTDIPGKSFIRIFATLPLVLPTLVGAQAWIMMFGYSGFVTKFLRGIGINIPSIYGWPGMVLVFVLQFYPFVFSMVSASLLSIDSSIEEASENLGASPIRKFRTVTLPLLIPALLSSSLLVFMQSAENFAVPALMGKGYRMLTIEVYRNFASELGSNRGMASTLGMVLVLITMGALFLQKFIIARREYRMSGLSPLEVRKLKRLPKVLTTAIAYFIVFLSLLPFIVIFYLSFVKSNGPVMFYGHLVFSNYLVAFHTAMGAIRNSYFLATVSTTVGVTFAVLVSYILVRKKYKSNALLDFLTTLPLGIPGLVLGIALISSFNSGVLVLTGTWMIIALSYFLRKTAFAVKSASSVLYQLDPSLEEASISLGARPMRTFARITLPLILAGVVSGAVLMWITTMCELSSTVVLYYGPWSTMAIEIYQRMSSGEFGTAAAFSALMTASVLIPLLIINKIFGKSIELGSS